MNFEHLSIWTVYDHPTDFPENFVTRRFVILRGNTFPTDDFIVSNTLEPLREHLLERGLACLPRQEGDDPKIIESWI